MLIVSVLFDRSNNVESSFIRDLKIKDVQQQGVYPVDVDLKSLFLYMED
jgi:hypothetical protein